MRLWAIIFAAIALIAGRTADAKLSEDEMKRLRAIFRLTVKHWLEKPDDLRVYQAICENWQREDELSDEEYGRVEFLHNAFSLQYRHVEIGLILNAMEMLTHILRQDFKSKGLRDAPVYYALRRFRVEPQRYALGARLERLAAGDDWIHPASMLEAMERNLRCGSATRLKRRLLYAALQFVEFVKPPAVELPSGDVIMAPMNLIPLTDDQTLQLAGIERYVKAEVAKKLEREAHPTLATTVRHAASGRRHGDTGSRRRSGRGRHSSTTSEVLRGAQH